MGLTTDYQLGDLELAVMNLIWRQPGQLNDTCAHLITKLRGKHAALRAACCHESYHIPSGGARLTRQRGRNVYSSADRLRRFAANGAIGTLT